MSFRSTYPILLVTLVACGGSVDNGGKGGSGGVAGNPGGGGVGTGGFAAGGSGGISTGGVSTGGFGAGGVGTGGIGTGGFGTGGFSTGGFGAGGSGGVGPADFCSVLCKDTSNPSCPNTTPYAQCMAGCPTDFPTISQACGPIVDELYNCFLTSAQFSCSPNGISIQGCDKPVVDYVQCTACVPLSGDDKCQSCSKAACCAERSALYGSPAFAGFYVCVLNCQGPNCQQNCFNQYPDVMKLLQAVQSCQSAKCGC